jgi:hypothetical protein
VSEGVDEFFCLEISILLVFVRVVEYDNWNLTQGQITAPSSIGIVNKTLAAAWWT